MDSVTSQKNLKNLASRRPSLNGMAPDAYTGISLAVLIVYLSYVHYRRYDRLKAIESKFKQVWEDGSLTPEQAQEILQNNLFYENPLMIRLGTQSALFKVYALPSFANLLVKTGQLKSPETISKRVADTATLIATWISCPLVRPGTGNTGSEIDPRGAIAVARVNFLHGKYRIANNDFLYNLALFIQEPMDWMALYDWRKPTEMERDAVFIFWKEIGDRMGIKDIWATRLEMTAWVKTYEQKHIVPSKNAEILAKTTLSFFLRRFPAAFGIRRFFENLALCLLDNRTRHAMGLRNPPALLLHTVHTVLICRALLVRYACLPRRRKSLYVTLDGPSSIDNLGKARMHATYRRPIPWYWHESKGLRRIWENFLVAVGLVEWDKIPGPRWKSEGYRLEELGPLEFEHDGEAEVLEAAGKLQGVPVTGLWA